MNVREITEKYLRENVLDGLANGETCCGCGLEDFMPCGPIDGPHYEDCKAAKKVPCKPEDCENCEWWGSWDDCERRFGYVVVGKETRA